MFTFTCVLGEVHYTPVVMTEGRRYGCGCCCGLPRIAISEDVKESNQNRCFHGVLEVECWKVLVVFLSHHLRFVPYTGSCPNFQLRHLIFQNNICGMIIE